MKIEKVSSYITPKTTGYTATIGLSLTMICGSIKNKTCRKIHKPIAWITLFASLFHIGLIEYYKYKFKN